MRIITLAYSLFSLLPIFPCVFNVYSSPINNTSILDEVVVMDTEKDTEKWGLHQVHSCQWVILMEEEFRKAKLGSSNLQGSKNNLINACEIVLQTDHYRGWLVLILPCERRTKRLCNMVRLKKAQDSGAWGRGV